MGEKPRYLRDTAQIFRAISIAETEPSVESRADFIAIGEGSSGFLALPASV